MEMVVVDKVWILVLKYKVTFCPHSKSKKMWLWDKLAALFGTKNWKKFYWLTLGKTIYHPDSAVDPMLDTDTCLHELIHVGQQSKTWLPWWVTKYICSWRFRWKMEREAYLENIARGASPEYVAMELKDTYRIPLSIEEMVSWFERHRK